MNGEKDEMSKQEKEKDFNGVVVFSATKAMDRDRLGEVITKWMRENPKATVVDKTITQSSDSEFHCVTITLWYALPEGVAAVDGRDFTPRTFNGNNGNGQSRQQVR